MVKDGVPLASEHAQFNVRDVMAADTRGTLKLFRLAICLKRMYSLTYELSKVKVTGTFERGLL